MSRWTRRHQALLDALRADRVGPALYASLVGKAGSDADPAWLRDWVISMRADPGWAHLRHVWDKPAAFPEAWDEATQAGWSGRTDHHNALLFEELAMSHLETGEIERAEWCWRHCLDAWTRCAGSGHYRELLDALSDGADPSVIAQANRRVLEPRAAQLADALRDALALDAERSRAVDIAHADDVMGLVRLLAEREPDAPNSPIQHGAATMREHLQRARRDSLSAFERGIDSVDLLEDDRPALLGPFERLAARFRVLDIDDETAVSVIDATVAEIWKIRKLDRGDEDAVISSIIDAVRPFADVLAGALDAGRLMGRQSLAADFLVFRGEQLDDTSEREAVFERALELCPGHRNASMMLSYVRLTQAHQIIASLSLVPGPVGKLPKAGERLEASVRIAHSYVEDAARVFPNNEELPEYRSDVRELAERLGVEL